MQFSNAVALSTMTAATSTAAATATATEAPKSSNKGPLTIAVLSENKMHDNSSGKAAANATTMHA